MAHMKFSYASSHDPLETLMSFLLGVAYAASFILSITSIFYNLCIITENKWLDGLIWLVIGIVLVFIQNFYNRAISKPDIKEKQPEEQQEHIEDISNISDNKGKIRYCKYCGGKINNITKQCSSCGKVSFLRKYASTIAITLLTLLLIAASVLIVLLIIQNTKLNDDITLLDNSNVELQQTVSDLTLELSTLTENYTLLESSKNELETKYKENTRSMIEAIYELSDYQNNFAYVTEAGTKYHKKSCSILFNVDTLYCDTIYELERNGYTSCLICY